MNNEIWKDIPGFEGYYQVSTEGRVKRLSRKIPGKAKVTQLKYEKCLNERVLTPQHDKCRLCSLSIKTPRWQCLVMETDINQLD